MTETLADSLTEKQRYWFAHLKAAEQQSDTLVKYAKEHAIEIKSLYSWRDKFRKLGLLAPSSFTRVRVNEPKPTKAQTDSRIEIRFANGITCIVHADPVGMVALLGKVKSL